MPIYVGQSVDGIRSRVNRHLTSARSDIIANRQVDVWEIAWVWAGGAPSGVGSDDLDAAIVSVLQQNTGLGHSDAVMEFCQAAGIDIVQVESILHSPSVITVEGKSLTSH